MPTQAALPFGNFNPTLSKLTASPRGPDYAPRSANSCSFPTLILPLHPQLLLLSLSSFPLRSLRLKLSLGFGLLQLIDGLEEFLDLIAGAGEVVLQRGIGLFFALDLEL